MAELAPSLVGSWRLVSYETKRADGAAGSASHPFGDAPIGLFIFDPDGNYSVQLSNPADSGSWVGSWGRYEVDEAEVMFILEPTAGTAQLPTGTKTTRRVTLNGNGTATFRPPVQVVEPGIGPGCSRRLHVKKRREEKRARGARKCDFYGLLGSTGQAESDALGRAGLDRQRVDRAVVEARLDRGLDQPVLVEA